MKENRKNGKVPFLFRAAVVLQQDKSLLFLTWYAIGWRADKLNVYGVYEDIIYTLRQKSSQDHRAKGYLDAIRKNIVFAIGRQYW